MIRLEDFACTVPRAGSLDACAASSSLRCGCAVGTIDILKAAVALLLTVQLPDAGFLSNY